MFNLISLFNHIKNVIAAKEDKGNKNTIGFFEQNGMLCLLINKGACGTNRKRS